MLGSNSVPGIAINDFVSMLHSNKENSKPLGCRVYRKIGSNLITCPDSTKFNTLNANLSALFIDGSFIASGNNTYFIEGVDSNADFYDFDSRSKSYVSMFSSCLQILNYTKLRHIGEDVDSNFAKTGKSNDTNGLKGRRNFSTSISKGAYNNMFIISDIHAFTLEMHMQFTGYGRIN
jgi:hypothetical protein